MTILIEANELINLHHSMKKKIGLIEKILSILTGFNPPFLFHS